MRGAIARLLGLPVRAVTKPFSRDCLQCGEPLPISGLRLGSKKAILDRETPPFQCPACGTRQRYHGGSFAFWFFLLGAVVAWIGFGPVSQWLETTFPQLLVFDRQDYALGPDGFVLLAVFYFAPAMALLGFTALHVADLEVVP